LYGYVGSFFPDSITSQGFEPILRVGGQAGILRGTWIAVGPPGPVTGTAYPKYMVLLVAYSPPGTNGGSTSLVNYAAGSTAGTTTSVSNTFKQNYSVTADTGIGLIGSGVGGSLSFSYARSTTSDHSIELKKTTNSSIGLQGPRVDGIDHNRDLIYLWLNPQATIALTPSSAVWTFVGTPVPIIQFVEAGWLKDPSCTYDAQTHPTCMPDADRRTLRDYGVTEVDFPDILRHDVLATVPSTLDPKRFKSLNTTFPYEPADEVPTFSFTQTNTRLPLLVQKLRTNMQLV
jgi:hypothetical protein